MLSIYVEKGQELTAADIEDIYSAATSLTAHDDICKDAIVSLITGRPFHGDTSLLFSCILDGGLFDDFWFHLKLCSLKVRGHGAFRENDVYTLAQFQKRILYEKPREAFEMAEDDQTTSTVRYAVILMLIGQYDRALDELASCHLLVEAGTIGLVLHYSGVCLQHYQLT